MSGITAFNECLGRTARWTASVRAMESKREDCLFKDPLAGALAGTEGEAWIEHRSPESVLPMVIRTRYFDDFLQRISNKEEIRQVVLLGAGLDTRAFRLQWADQTRLFELDQPGVLAYKEQVLSALGAKPRCNRAVIGVDLTLAWDATLQQQGFDPGVRSAWLLEGFLFYLPKRTIEVMLEAVTSLAGLGSWLGFDIINGEMLTSPYTHSWVEMQAQAGAPWIGSMDDPEGFLNRHGWRTDLTQAGAADANYGRWTYPVIPTRMAGMPHNWYVTAVKER